MILTTSWDDGYRLDLQLAKMLERYSCKGTFYACPHKQHNQPMMTDQEIRDISTRHEIGAHTMTHPRLTTIHPEQALEEITTSKQWIEDRIGTECRMFCYPKGACNDAVANMVQMAGFAAARTVEQLQFSTDNIFLLPTSLHIYPFPVRRKYDRWKHIVDPLGPLRVKYSNLRKLEIPITSMRGWLPLAKSLFVSALERNETFFHLWGHSAEVENMGMWKDLEAFLQFVTEYKDVHPMTNGELVDILTART